MSPRLKRGDMAPELLGVDLDDRTIRLSDYRGRWLLLSFYRYASCPLCNLRVHELSQCYATWQAQGLDMLAVFQSPADKLRQYVGRQQAPFPIVADAEQQLYAQYRVRHSWPGFLKAWLTRLPEIARSVVGRRFFPGSVEGGIHRVPADFVIAPDGRIVEAYYGRDIGDHLPVEQLKCLLQSAGVEIQ